MGKNVSIVMYHYVRDLKNSRYPNIKGLDYKLFKAQLEFFNRYYNVITIEELIAAYKESYELPDNAILLTFDDGYIDHFIFAFPILKEYGMQGAFFIPGKAFAESVLLDVNKIHFILASVDDKILVKDLFELLNYYRGKEFDVPDNEKLFADFAIASRFDTRETIFAKRLLQTVLPERLRTMIASRLFEKYVGGVSERQFAKELYMNYDQIKLMKNSGMYIGPHGYDHYWLANLSPEEIETDITKSLECMEGLFDQSSWVMNYPYGSYNDEVICQISSRGCILGLNTEVRVCDIAKDNPYKLPRLDTNDFPPKSKNYINYMPVSG